MSQSDVYKQNQRLGRGINIIGYDPLWKSKARMQDRHFRLIKEAGFSNVRIPLHPFRDAGLDVENKLTDVWLAALDWAIEQSLLNGLMTILDFHEFSTMGKDPIGNKERFMATWEQMSERYNGYPQEVMFEILNEPNKELTPELWNQFHREALAIIRATNPTRNVIIGPGHWNNISYLSQLNLPENDRNIIVTVHYYSPMEFTHQGASWAGRKDKIGVKWNATPEETQAVIDDFLSAQAWAEKHDRPLFLGEFGVYDKAEMDSRVRYLNFVTRQAEKLGWSWAYWQFDSDFILYDIQNDRWIEPIRDALIPPQR